MKYCYLEPYYPETAYFVGIFYTDEESLLFHPLRKLMNNLDEIQQSVTKLAGDLEALDPDTKVIEYAPIVSLRLIRKQKLEKRFWDNPSIEYDPLIRMIVFSELLQLPQLYHMLVTPAVYLEKNKKWLLEAAFPFKSSTNDDETIDKFMLSSDLKVDHRGKYAAIYECLESKTFNWETKEVMDVYNKSALGRAISIKAD